MCTLSFLPPGHLGDQAASVGMNRDERKSRPLALTLHVDKLIAVYPVDPQGGGTWISLTSQGLVFALMNQAGEQAPGVSEAQLISRGRVIPSLLTASTAEEALKMLPELKLYRPFVLVVIDSRREKILSLRWKDGQTSPNGYPYGPFLLSSSSLNEGEEIARRKTRFEEWLASTRESERDLMDFHQKILIERKDARTVSFTQILCSEKIKSLTYRPILESALSEDPRLRDIEPLRVVI